jgi:hypothetical protein
MTSEMVIRVASAVRRQPPVFFDRRTSSGRLNMSQDAESCDIKRELACLAIL